MTPLTVVVSLYEKTNRQFCSCCILMNLLILTRQTEAGLVEVPLAPVPGGGARRSVQIWSPKIPLSWVDQRNNFACVGLPFNSFHSLALVGQHVNTYTYTVYYTYKSMQSNTRALNQFETYLVAIVIELVKAGLSTSTSLNITQAKWRLIVLRTLAFIG